MDTDLGLPSPSNGGGGMREPCLPLSCGNPLGEESCACRARGGDCVLFNLLSERILLVLRGREAAGVDFRGMGGCCEISSNDLVLGL